MINTKKAKFINIVAKLLKQFTKSEEFFEKTGLNRSSSYFNINLYKSLLKYLLLKTSCLPFHYFKNNFKKIKVCKLNGSFLKKKKKNYYIVLLMFFNSYVQILSFLCRNHGCDNIMVMRILRL